MAMNNSYSYKPSEEEDREFEEEEKAALNSSIGGTPFNVLMQQAGKLKSKQGEVFRAKYDKYPPWYQHSMFATQDISDARGLEFPERMKVALAYKEKGSASLKADELYDAMHDYERALSIFKWLENMKENWMKKEIEDSMIKECEYTPQTVEETEALKTLQCSCLLNLALVYSRQLQWNDVIRACTAVLEKDPTSSKAYFRRAQARYRPIYCGATENEMALADLKQALSLRPEDKVIRREYNQLKSGLEKQRIKDTKQFGGLFDRGRVVEEGTEAGGSVESAGGHMTVEEGLRSLKDAESTCKRYYEDGRYEDAARLQKTVDRLKKDIDDFTSEQKKKNTQQKTQRNPFLDMDLANITSEQREDAKKSGLDLDDPKVQEYIADIQRELQMEEQQKKSKPSLSQLKVSSADNGKDQMKAVMDRLESRKLVDILSKGWDSADNAELVSKLLANRILYANEHEMPTQRVEELDDDEDEDEDEEGNGNGDGFTVKAQHVMDKDSPYEALYEHMVDDMSALYEAELARMGAGEEKQPGNEFSDRIMAMMEEKYQLRAVETALREGQKQDWRSTFLYVLLGFLLFRFFVVPNYNRFCDSYCVGVDCTDSMLCSPISEGDGGSSGPPPSEGLHQDIGYEFFESDDSEF